MLTTHQPTPQNFTAFADNTINNQSDLIFQVGFLHIRINRGENITGDNMKNEDKNRHYEELQESTTYIPDSPETPYEMVNKYGTYEIQPTGETANSFPTIAQGLPKHRKKPSVKQGFQRKKDSL